ncbi:zinc finger protein 629 [Uranotaenia lowii]|uniref:zinc finger protein 629 n=1 Tax=Uranotaenia lowii TaxID=190385 RepID=UPI00247874B7|nr:zinc finger protein 629 [Uranotaenia lowii]XP_055606981.1 zinc finger protein 629 [Uranotaenia lowii]XP_055606982.1 zinc finger protein 629 [Uranotaenia lowii]
MPSESEAETPAVSSPTPGVSTKKPEVSSQTPGTSSQTPQVSDQTPEISSPTSKVSSQTPKESSQTPEISNPASAVEISEISTNNSKAPEPESEPVNEPREDVDEASDDEDNVTGTTDDATEGEEERDPEPGPGDVEDIFLDEDQRSTASDTEEFITDEPKQIMLEPLLIPKDEEESGDTLDTGEQAEAVDQMECEEDLALPNQEDQLVETLEEEVYGDEPAEKRFKGGETWEEEKTFVINEEIVIDDVIELDPIEVQAGYESSDSSISRIGNKSDFDEDDGDGEVTPSDWNEHAYTKPEQRETRSRPLRQPLQQKHIVPRAPIQIKTVRTINEKLSPPVNVKCLLRTENSLYNCLECKQSYKTMDLFLKHRTKHLLNRRLPISCQYCTRKFAQRSDLSKHQMSHTKLELLKCPLCELKFFSATNLATHMESHKIPDNLYRCTICWMRFSGIKQLAAHQRVEHSTQVATITPHRTRTVYVCFFCGKVEEAWTNLLIHMRQHKGPLLCTVCNAPMRNSDSFADHVASIHQDRGELVYYRCANTVCNQYFVSTADLNRHELTCLPKGGELCCEICEEKFRELEHFITHLKLHVLLSREGTRKRCEECDFDTPTAADYALHLVRRHGYRDTIASVEAYYRKGTTSKMIINPSLPRAGF